jgi:hypothetical protein
MHGADLMVSLYRNPDGTIARRSDGALMRPPTQEEYDECCCGKNVSENTCSYCAITPAWLLVTLSGIVTCPCTVIGGNSLKWTGSPDFNGAFRVTQGTNPCSWGLKQAGLWSYSTYETPDCSGDSEEHVFYWRVVQVLMTYVSGGHLFRVVEILCKSEETADAFRNGLLAALSDHVNVFLASTYPTPVGEVCLWPKLLGNDDPGTCEDHNAYPDHCTGTTGGSATVEA